MRKQLEQKQWILLCLGALCTGALLAAGAASAAVSAARVTVATGTALSGDEAVEQRAALGEGADLETGDDGNCSLLVDEDALVELCGSTSLKLERKGGLPDGPRVVNLERGEIRMVVEPRLAEERIEIHTPAAIATILGTVVHVSVDADGVTTITAAANRVRIESSDPSVPGSTIIDAGQQVVIAPGEAPPSRPATVSPKIMASLGGCLIDFHQVALQVDRAAQAGEKLEEIVNDEIADAAAADIAAPPPGAPTGDPTGDGSPVDDPEPQFTQTETGAITLELLAPRHPDCPLPGEHCG